MNFFGRYYEKNRKEKSYAVFLMKPLAIRLLPSGSLFMGGMPES